MVTIVEHRAQNPADHRGRRHYGEAGNVATPEIDRTRIRDCPGLADRRAFATRSRQGDHHSTRQDCNHDHRHDDDPTHKHDHFTALDNQRMSANLDLARLICAELLAEERGG
jgi:ABC-type Zn2+ transport system substrate-binding protein/surface adhesin